MALWRVQAGMPLDLFDAAGIVARIRLEASANVRASVTAAMSAGEMRGLVTAALPAEAFLDYETKRQQIP